MRKDDIGTIRLTRTESEASAAPGDRRVLLRFRLKTPLLLHIR